MLLPAPSGDGMLSYTIEGSRTMRNRLYQVLKTKYSLLLFGERPERPESDVYCVSGESQSALCVVALG